MISPGQRLRNRHPHKLRRPCVVRIVQQPSCSISRSRHTVGSISILYPILRAEALEPRRVRIPQRSRKQSNDSIDNHRRSQLAPGENIVSDRNLAVAQQLIHPLIHALIPSTEEHHPLGRGKLLSH